MAASSLDRALAYVIDWSPKLFMDDHPSLEIPLIFLLLLLLLSFLSVGPKGVAVNQSGQLVVVDNKASCVFIFQLNGKMILKFGTRGSEAKNLAGPHYVAINSQGHIIVSDFHNHSIKVRTVDQVI